MIRICINLKNKEKIAIVKNDDVLLSRPFVSVIEYIPESNVSLTSDDKWEIEAIEDDNNSKILDIAIDNIKEAGNEKPASKKKRGKL